MDWIDKAIRGLCELPDRSSPEGDPDAVVATPSEIRAAIESNMPSGITDLQRQAIGGLLALAGATFFALDDSEELSDGKVLIEQQHMAEMSAALDALYALPDDQPGYVMNETAKAAWALRDLTPNANVTGLAPTQEQK